MKDLNENSNILDKQCSKSVTNVLTNEVNSNGWMVRMLYNLIMLKQCYKLMLF